MSLHINFLSWKQARQKIKPPPSQYFSMKFHERHQLISKRKTVVKTHYKLQKRWPHTTTWQIRNFLWNYTFFPVLYIILHEVMGLEVLKTRLYLLKNTVNKLYNHLILISLGTTMWKNLLLCAWESHMLKKQKQKKKPKTNSSKIPPQQNYSLKHIYLHEGLIFTRQCHFLIISKLIIHFIWKSKGQRWTYFINLTYTYPIAEVASSYSNTVHFTTEDQYCILN